MQTDQKVRLINGSAETTAEDTCQPELSLCLQKMLRRIYDVEAKDNLPSHCYQSASKLDYERLTPYIQTLIIDDSLKTFSDFERMHLDLLDQLYASNALSTSPSIIESIFRVSNGEKSYGEIIDYMILFERQFLTQGQSFLKYTAEMLCEVYQVESFADLMNSDIDDFRLSLLLLKLKQITEA
jgi:hypothetical protein